MRSPGAHAALGTFTAMEAPTGAVMKRGVPFSSVARFLERSDLGTASLLLQSQGGRASDYVRLELLAKPDETGKLSGVEFELLGGASPLGRGKILKVADELTRKERIVFFAIRHPGKTDREIADALDGVSSKQQPTNQACRELESIGKLRRSLRRDGRIGNYPVSELYVSPVRPVGNTKTEVIDTACTGGVRLRIGQVASTNTTTSDSLQEDEVKACLEEWLNATGWRTEIAWGKERGVDIEAVGRDGQRWLIEVKGCGSRQPMRVNYFVAVLGESLQRMDDPNARYSIAFPDMAQFHGLWERLPQLAKDRTGITALFVGSNGQIRELRQ